MQRRVDFKFVLILVIKHVLMFYLIVQQCKQTNIDVYKSILMYKMSAIVLVFVCNDIDEIKTSSQSKTCNI